MSEEEVLEPQPSNKPSLVRRMAVLLGVAMAAIIVVLLLYRFVIQPRLSSEAREVPEVPSSSVPVPFERASTSVVMPPDSNMPASLLQYRVTLLVSNQRTADIIKANESWFTDMLRELHSGHPRDKVDDPMLLKSIQKQALLKSNEILNTIQGGENPNNRVLKVFHDEFFVYDQ